jgi:guanylate kinase
MAKIPVHKPTETKTEFLLLLGASGSGKDYMMRKMTEKGLIPGIKTTTRPPRKYEIQGVTYDFVDDVTFQAKINCGEMMFYQRFEVAPIDREPEVWYYGITKEEFERAQVFIITPGEFKTIDPEIRKGCFVVYLDIDRDIRENRILGRRDMNDSIKRRMDADDEDFKEFNKSGDYDLRVTDPDFNADDVWALMM